MKEKTKGLCILLALCLSVLAPYHRLILGQELPIPSDISISDLADGEFPLRVEAGKLLHAGELPYWTPNIITGAPLWVDPLSLFLFSLFPPALALGLIYGAFLVVTATGAYRLSRHLGASRAGAFLSGFAFAWSGFFVCQMRHLSIIGTVALFPYALYCLERALSLRERETLEGSPAQPRSRLLLWLMIFGLLFGLQILAGFPQTVYICSLFYGLLILWRLVGMAVRARQGFVRQASPLLAGLLGAGLLGVLMGMMLLLPLWELGSVSDRSAGISFEAATALPYPLACAITFFCPYYYGDISNLSFAFMKETLFWEVYGYAGMFTLLLAVLAMGIGLYRLVRLRSRLTPENALGETPTRALLFWILIGLLSFCMVLGPLTPLYELAFYGLPGFSSFRFPTRFLFVTVLAITVLGGLGLTWLQTALSRFLPPEAATRNRLFLGALLVGLTMADLVYHNRRQNPMVESRTWLAAPQSARLIREEQSIGRVYAPDAFLHHKRSLFAAKGWGGDVTPLYLHREFLQPNSNLLHGLPTLGAYVPISPSWVVDLIGDHNRYGLLPELRMARPPKAYYAWLQALCVEWMIFPIPQESPVLDYKGPTSPESHLYHLSGSLPRARFAQQLLQLNTVEEIKKQSLDGTLDPRLTTLIHSKEDMQAIQTALLSWAKTTPVSTPTPAVATIRVARATEVVIEAHAPQGGLLVLADTYYPGWKALLNQVETPILRVNVMHRGVLVPPGKQTITFRYQPWTVRWGILLSLLGFLVLVSLILYFYHTSKERP